MTSLHSINCFGYAETFKIPSDPSGMIAIYIALIFFFSSNTPVRVPPSEPDVKWNTWSFVSCICVQFFYASRADLELFVNDILKRVKLGTRMESVM